MKQKVVIEVLSNVRCRIVGAPKALLKHLDDRLAEQQKGSEWSPTHRRFGGRWDGKKHHFHKSPTKSGVGTFPKGLLSRVRTLCAQKKVCVKVRDLRKNLFAPIDTSKLKPDMLIGVSMAGEYSYQLDAVKAALAGEAGVLYMATNAGKTEIAAAIVKTLSERSILFVVPKAILLKQTRERIAERLGTIPENIGVIGGGRFQPKDITIAIINSITPAKKARSERSKRKNAILREYLKTVECVFLDEGHHAKASTWFRLMNSCTNAQYRYLMSGTPFTGDNDLMIEAAAGPVLYEIRNDDLIKLGVSAKPRVRIITVDKPDLEGDDALLDGSWHSVYTAGVVENEFRNGIIAREAARYSKQGKNVLVLMRILAQGSTLRTLIAAENIPVEFAHGKMPGIARDAIVDWFQDTKGAVLVGSNIFDEGFSINNINALIVADGGKSLRATLQKVGRSIRRKKKGSNVVDVIDFADCTHHWLAKHALDRFDIYTGEGFDVVEESPNQKYKKNAGGGRDGSRTDQPAGSKAVPPLPREDDGRDELPRSAVERTLRITRSAAEESANALPEERAIVCWRWRQTA